LKSKNAHLGLPLQPVSETRAPCYFRPCARWTQRHSQWKSIPRSPIYYSKTAKQRTCCVLCRRLFSFQRFKMC